MPLEGKGPERKPDCGRELTGWSKQPEKSQASNQGRTVSFGIPLLSNLDFHMAGVKLELKDERVFRDINISLNSIAFIGS